MLRSLKDILPEEPLFTERDLGDYQLTLEQKRVLNDVLKGLKYEFNPFTSYLNTSGTLYAVIPNQYFLYACKVYEVAVELYKYVEIFDKIRKYGVAFSKDAKSIVHQIKSNQNVFDVFNGSEKDVELFALFLESDDNHESKKNPYRLESKQPVTSDGKLRGSRDFFGSAILKVTNLTEASSGAFGALVYDLCVNGEAYERLLSYYKEFEGESEIVEVNVNVDFIIEQACTHFKKAVSETGLVYEPSFVNAFLLSLATKRFVILTGLSGSGKTQIAMKFGEWLGQEYFQITAVRPDWTGAEALFGYEDALAVTSEDGRRGWAVPKPLEFMLQAHNNPEYPYLLILDEMNLAHVERYFADVLSGMESDFPTLPNLERGDDGVWRTKVGEPAYVSIPSNLFIIGTVNVDETTYMFSPKVLDRANTIEFRVPTDLLQLQGTKPTVCNPASTELTRGFLSLTRARAWKDEPPAVLENYYAEKLRVLHGLLAEAGFEFGHRVFFEASRYAAFHLKNSPNNLDEALDRQVMQKILPRLHGSRRRLEATLCALGKFCFDLSFEPGTVLDGSATKFDPVAKKNDEPKLPISLDKVSRMTRNLRANQFTSFTE